MKRIGFLAACLLCGCSRSPSPPATFANPEPARPVASTVQPESAAPVEADKANSPEENNPFADSQQIVIEDAPAKTGVDVPALASEPAEPRKSFDEVAESVVRALRRGTGADEPRENDEPSILETIGRALGKGIVEGIQRPGQ